MSRGRFEWEKDDDEKPAREKPSSGSGSGDLALVADILERLYTLTSMSFRAVPAAFRPAGMAKQIDEVGVLVAKLKKKVSS